MKIDSKAIRELAELLQETDLTEIEIADGDKAIRVAKGGTATAVAAPPVVMTSDPAIPQQANVSTDAVLHTHPGGIKSPMVGTAYMQAEPNSPAFVSKGDIVKAGDTLMIIEAMKVMNPIKAETAGTVTQILVEDGQPIEFGDILMVIE